MKALFLVPMLLCTYVQAAVLVNNEAPVESATTSFKIEDMHLNMLAANSAFTKEDQLTADELSALDAVALNAVETMIRDLLESFRPIVVNGNDYLPPLDPLTIESAGPFVVEVATGTRANIAIHNFLMDGLRWYVVDDVNFSPLRLTFGLHMTLPWLTFTGTYEADARIGPLVVHRAGGNYRIFINRFELGVEMRLGTNLLGGHLLLRTLDIKLDVQDVNIRVDGMVGSSLINAFINNLVQSITQDVVQNEMENISQMLSEELFDVINEFLKDYTLADLLD
uniref:Lipid-binding serum glycoprotein N-terminal domain-containing protein n=1 Tax=Picea sitchensis TaxID=3332 RepID=A9NQH1_PICSI|nr:unknown [Picea sitchensis]